VRRRPVVVFTLWTGDPGGAENHTWRLCSQLRRCHDLDARVLFLQHEGILGKHLRDEGIPTASLGLAVGLRGPVAARRLAQQLRAWAALAVVSGAYAWDHALLALPGSRRPLIVVEHGGTLLNPGVFTLRRRASYLATRWAFARAATAEVCVSRFMKTRQEAVPHARRLVVIRNGVDTEVFVPEKRRRHPCPPIAFGAAGRLDSDKGFDLLIYAFREVVDQRGPDCRLRIAGKGTAEHDLRQLVGRLGLDHQVHFLGRTADMPAFWRQQHVACVPSPLLESFGMVAAEAQAAGLPVVATASGALPEVVKDGYTGRLVRPGDVRSLSCGMREYLDNPDRIESQGKAARLWAESALSLKRTACRYDALIRDVIDGKSGVN
jgi:glycosyltransferase involved in cell wall biosynthesis